MKQNFIIIYKMAISTATDFLGLVIAILNLFPTTKKANKKVNEWVKWLKEIE